MGYFSPITLTRNSCISLNDAREQRRGEGNRDRSKRLSPARMLNSAFRSKMVQILEHSTIKDFDINCNTNNISLKSGFLFSKIQID